MKRLLDPLLGRFLGTSFGAITHFEVTKPHPGLGDFHVGTARCSNPVGLGGSEIWPLVSSGQGYDRRKALSAALGESLERNGATMKPWRSKLEVTTHEELFRLGKALPLEDYTLFSAEQMKTWSPEENRRAFFRNLEASDRIPWLPGVLKTASAKRDIWFPHARVGMGRELTLPYDQTTTNGLALGSSAKMAFENALGEVLERDALLSHWWLKKSPPSYAGSELRELPLGSVGRMVEVAGDRLFLLDLSERWGLPTFIAVLKGREERSEPAFIIGGRCDEDPYRAIAKAIEESVRVFLTFQDHKRRGRLSKIRPPYDESIRSFHDIASLYSDPESLPETEFLFAGPRPGARELRRSCEAAVRETGSMESRVLARGARLLTFDLTPVDLAQGGLHLVRVVVPEAISLNCNHRLRPWGGPALRNHSFADLNPAPHPYT